MAFQDTWARPLANELVDLFRVASLNYIRIEQAYDPAVGDVVITETPYPSAGAVTKTMRLEEGGAAEVYAIEAWINAAGIGDIWPTTLDLLEYDGARWKVTNIDPQYSGDVKYACKVMARRA